MRASAWWNLVPLLSAWGLSACGATVVEGRLVDGLSGSPIPEARLLAKAQGAVSLPCQTFAATTDAEGHFSLEGLCLSETGYHLEPESDELFLARVAEVPKGASGPLEVPAWRAPAGRGTYELSGTELTAIPTHADVGKERVYRSEEEVRYPKTLPAESSLRRLEAGEYLVITGPADLSEVEITPLLRSEARRFGTPSEWTDMEPWWYLGVEFASNTEFTRKVVELDPARITTVGEGERVAHFLPGDLFPAGRYAVGLQGDRGRVRVFDVGSAPAE